MESARSIFGIFAMIFIAWLLSSHRRRFPVRIVLGGLALQLALGLVVLRTTIGRDVFTGIARLVTTALDCTTDGARFVLGNLVDIQPDNWGAVFAATALPSIIVFSALSAIGYHLGILQFVVGIVARIMTRILGVSGAESLSAAGNVFLGQTEAPLLVRPYINKMTRSELMALMVGGFATVAGGVLASYIAILGGDDPAKRIEVARHFLTACLMSAPASFVIAKIMIPETEIPETAGQVESHVEKDATNVIHAAANGAANGLKLALNVGAMLIAFIAIIAMLDGMLSYLGQLSFVKPVVTALGMSALDLRNILGLLFSPIAYLIGIDTHECRAFGSLLGTAVASNEFVAYLSLADLTADNQISERATRLAMYALCGFANFSSIAIQIAGIGGIAPERRADLAKLGLRAMFGGAIACWMTAAIAAILT